MKYLFDVCLWNKGDPDHGPVLSLPATPYELLDALEKVRTENGAPVHWKIIGVYSNQFNIPISEEAGSVYELNAFAQKLSELNDSQQIACCGLLKMEQEQAGHPRPIYCCGCPLLYVSMVFACLEKCLYDKAQRSI